MPAHRPARAPVALRRGALLSLHLVAACGETGDASGPGTTGTPPGTTTGIMTSTTSTTATPTTDASTSNDATTDATPTGDAGTTSTTSTTGSTADTTSSAASDDTTGEILETICAPWPAPASPYDQSVVPIEVEPQDPAAVKIVLVAGAPSLDHPPGAHEFFAGTALFARMLCQVPGVVPVLVKDGWPANEQVFVGAAAIVFYLDGRDAHPLTDPAKYAALAPAIAAGAGFVNLHYAVDYHPALGAQILPWLGGYYEDGYSVNPIWQAHYADLPAHPVTNGVDPLTINDEWYYNMRWLDGMPGITAILKDVPPEETRTTPDTQAHPGRSEITAWTFDRPDGGRGFGSTGGHWYGNWIDSVDTPDAAKLRRIVVNGILWSANVPVPPEGAPVTLDPADQGMYLDTK